MKRRYGVLIFVLAVLAVSLACNLSVSSPSSGEEEASGDAAASSDSADASESGATSETTASEDTGSAAPVGAAPAAEAVPSQPVPFNQGLASLNSYQATMSMQSSGPTAADMSIMEMEMRYAGDANARYTRTRTVSSSEEQPEPYEDISEVYQVSGENCTLSGGEWEFTALTPIEQEVGNLFTSMIDFTPVLHNPALVGEENVNGITTNHFQFQIPGLGVRSGALVSQSAGDYWLAQDGQYLVKYVLSLELRSGPETDPAAEVAQATFNAELTEINQPVSILLPAECLALREQQE